MNNLQNVFLFSLFAGFVVLEFALGKAKTLNASKADNILDMLCVALLAGFTQPFIFWVVQKAGLAWAPEYHNAWSALPWYAMAGILLIGDDMTQYWGHRASHSPLLWPLHRAESQQTSPGLLCPHPPRLSGSTITQKWVLTDPC